MMQPQELQREQKFAARVQQLLSAAIDKAKGFAGEHMVLAIRNFDTAKT